MELKSNLKKPYTEEQRLSFLVEQNHKRGYEIRETETELQAWGLTDEEKAQKERERIQELSITRSDFFDATIKAFGADGDDLLLVINKLLPTLQIDDVSKKIALNNFKNAQNFYRKHTLFTLLSDIDIPISDEVTIHVTPEQWDNFFDKAIRENTKAEAYKYLTNVTFEIIALPPDATVTINETEGESLSVPYGSDVEYSVTSEGYISQFGTVENLTEDKAIVVELEPEQVDTDSDTDSDLDTDNEQEIDK